MFSRMATEVGGMGGVRAPVMGTVPGPDETVSRASARAWRKHADARGPAGTSQHESVTPTPPTAGAGASPLRLIKRKVMFLTSENKRVLGLGRLLVVRRGLSFPGRRFAPYPSHRPPLLPLLVTV